jgi:hypothetical protein
MAKVTIGQDAVKLGRDLEIRIDGVPEDWSGELVVNRTKRITVDSRVFRLKANARNGFAPGPIAELYLLLVDSKGQQIPVPNGGRFRVSLIPSAAAVDREDRDFSADRRSDSFEVTARPDYQWSITDVPEWIKINSGQTGTGKGLVSYTVLENDSNESRSAVLLIGDATFTITQARPSSIQIPFKEEFKYPVPPPELWTLMHRGRSVPDESPARWIWERLGGQRSSVSIVRQAGRAGNSLLIDRAAADERGWATLVYLPHVNLRLGSAYRCTAYMKAEHPAEVAVLVSQGTQPWAACGDKSFIRVSQEWKEYEVPLRVAGQNCGPESNRLTIEAGRIQGKLWIADLALNNGE